MKLNLTREGWLGIGVLCATPFVFVTLVLIHVLTNVTSALEQIAEIVLAGMLVAGSTLVYRGRHWSRSGKVRADRLERMAAEAGRAQAVAIKEFFRELLNEPKEAGSAANGVLPSKKVVSLHYILRRVFPLVGACVIVMSLIVPLPGHFGLVQAVLILTGTAMIIYDVLRWSRAQYVKI